MSWNETGYIVSQMKKMSGSSGAIIVGQGPSFGSDGSSGLPPQDVVSFSATGGYDGVVELSFTPPPATLTDSSNTAYILCTPGGVKVIRKAGSAPRHFNDGVLVFDRQFGPGELGKAMSFTDTGLTNNVTYYYAIFPYSDHGVINYRMRNIVSAKPIPKPQYQIWAFDQNFDDHNPATTITYPINCNNYEYTPMMVNSSRGTPTLGSWKGFLEDTLQNFPYAVDPATGKAVKRLHPTNRYKYYDGTDVHYNDGWSHFAWINKMWMHEDYNAAGTSREVQFSNEAIDGFYSVGFYNYTAAANTYQPTSNIKGMWIPMYPLTIRAYNEEQTVTDISKGTCVFPIKNKNVYGIANTALHGSYYDRSNYATADDLYYPEKLLRKFDNGGVDFANRVAHERWFAIHNFLRDLLYMMGKNTAINTVFGAGTRLQAYLSYHRWDFTSPLSTLDMSGSLNGFFGTNDTDFPTPNDLKFTNELFYSQVLTGYGFSMFDDGAQTNIYGSGSSNQDALSVSPYTSAVKIYFNPYKDVNIYGTKLNSGNYVNKFAHRFYHIDEYCGSIPAVTDDDLNSSALTKDLAPNAVYHLGGATDGNAWTPGRRILYQDCRTSSYGAADTTRARDIDMFANFSVDKPLKYGSNLSSTVTFYNHLIMPLFTPPANYAPNPTE